MARLRPIYVEGRPRGRTHQDTQGNLNVAPKSAIFKLTIKLITILPLPEVKQPGGGQWWEGVKLHTAPSTSSLRSLSRLSPAEPDGQEGLFFTILCSSSRIKTEKTVKQNLLHKIVIRLFYVFFFFYFNYQINLYETLVETQKRFRIVPKLSS